MRKSISHYVLSWIGAAIVFVPIFVYGQAVPAKTDAVQVEQLLRELKTPNISQERILAIRSVGFEMVAASQYEAAAAIFEGVLAANPRDPQAAYGSALSLFNLKRLIQARELARLSIDYSGQDQARKAHALVLLGVILAVEGDTSAALAAVRQAVQLAPDNFDAQFALGRALYGSSDLGSAVLAFRKAVSLKPQHTQARFFLATTLEAAGEYGLAREAYNDLIRLDPNFAEGHLGLGVLLTKMVSGQSSEAISELAKAVSLQGDLYEARVALGRALIKAGRPQEAISHLEEAARLAPKNPEPLYQLALAYRRSGNAAAAAGVSARVAEINASRRGATKPTVTPPAPDNRN